MDWSSCSTNGVATLSCLPLLIATIISWAVTFAAVAALLFVIFAGYKYITSHGDPKKIDEARRTLVYAVIGLMLVFVSFLIVNLISGITGVKCLSLSNALSLTGCK